MEFKFQNSKEGLLVMVSSQNKKTWPTNDDWYGLVAECPEDWQEALSKKRRQLEDCLRKSQTLLIKCLEVAEVSGFPIL